MPRVVDVEERRQSITDATARLIARGGLGAATMRDIASESGWTTGVVTHYFVDKRELLLRTFEASLSQRQRRRPPSPDHGPRTSIELSLRSALPIDDAGRRHWLVSLAFCSEAAGDEALAEVQRNAYRGFRDNIARLVERATGAERDAAVTLAEHLIAVTDGIALQALFDPDSWPPARQLAALEATLAILDEPA